ncbi:MAG: topoisomerase DNA-binding C4 zinc finger domain-containing protein [Fusobacteriaceae bacterium]|nr:topoisomerase DNA-binding C4 zinc finger domain-containing protein [Fusobacteriaceae bacterium]
MEKENLGTKCLTANTLVKVNSNNQIHNEKISELFGSLHCDSLLETNQGIKIAINSKKTCFSFDEFYEIKSNFKLVSKRKLNKNEKVYRIEYKDGNFIELTEEHPLLIYNKDSCKYIPVKNLKKGMKSVSSIKIHDKIGEEIYSWKKFISKCHEKSSLYSDFDIKILRKNLPQYKFAAKYGLNQPRISVYEKRKNIPLYIFKKLDLQRPQFLNSENKNKKIKNPFPLNLSSPLVRILAKCVGDASIDKEKIRRENCYDFRYHNTDIDLINQFINDIYTLFELKLEAKILKPRPNQLPRYYVKIPAIIGRILSIIAKEIINKNSSEIITKKFYSEFIGSLFDDEGHAGNKEKKIFISNTNFQLLEEIKNMLNSLGIDSRIDKKQFKLYIRKVKSLHKFLEEIPFISKKKKERLVKLLYKEELVSSDFITKTISSIKEIDYDGHVYDITNNKENPNFILANGVVVHNSTRAAIIETLFNRGFIDGKAIEATELGIRTEETLEKHSPKIVEPALTRYFEEEMEEISEGKKEPEQVLEESKKAVTIITDEFDRHLKEIGKELLKATRETRNVMTFIGKCPNCKDGELHIRKGKFGQFIACNKYPKCTTTFSLPQAIVRPTKEICGTCGMPKVQIIKKRKGPQIICINPKCPSKMEEYDKEQRKEMEEIDQGKIEKECPKCGRPLVLRKSIYGAFLGCSGYPKCRYVEKLKDDVPLKEDFKKKR